MRGGSGNLNRLMRGGSVQQRASLLLNRSDDDEATPPEPWSNGQTEGQNTKFKLVKRQMYGRANLHLLRTRLLGAT